MTIPLSIIAFTLAIIGWYIGKFPVAVWIGRRALSAAGIADPSPYLGLLIGLVPLYLLFELPFMLGFFARWATIFLGLGAIYLGMRAATSPARSAPAEA